MSTNAALADAASRSWDVAVVGAGLAGSMAALGLARTGLSVLLVDRAKFPRWKVCGCCLNPNALSTLAAVGLGDVPRQLQAVPLPVARLGSRGVEARLALPGWVALSRLRLDDAMVAKAREAGAVFAPGVEARLGPATPDSRTVILRGEGGAEARVQARLVLAADGLGGRLLAEGLVTDARPIHVASGSRIGAGAVTAEAPAFYRPGEVYMAHAGNGYLGLVRLEDGRLNMAAAFDARFLRKVHHPGLAAKQVLREVGWPVVQGLEDLRWRGTPALTRHPIRLGSDRVLALGDAAGYVEPFTGEGMAWALASGAAVVEIAQQAVSAWQPAVIDDWTRLHQCLIGQRQWVCWATAWLTRHPSLTRAVLAALCAPGWRLPLSATSGLDDLGVWISTNPRYKQRISLKAIISDIHGNLEALQAVLEDIMRHPVDAIYCLGDLVVYGPNPRECVDLAMRWSVVIKGNFDHAILENPLDLTRYGSQVAARSLAWSRSELDAHVPDQQAANRRWTFLHQLMTKHQEDDFLFVHGSARNPLLEYVFPEDIYNEKKMQAVFSLVDLYSFMGHTHIPGIFTADLEFLAPEEVDGTYRLDARKTLINVGSVGQPRDGDWRACYVLLDGDTVRFRRIDYDIDTTIRKIRPTDDLDDWLGDRLRDGR